jgi:hypothetical protein
MVLSVLLIFRAIVLQIRRKPEQIPFILFFSTVFALDIFIEEVHLPSPWNIISDIFVFLATWFIQYFTIRQIAKRIDKRALDEE